MSDPDIVPELDTSKADKQLKALERRIMRTANRQIAAINRVTTLTVLSLRAFGVAVSQQFSIMLEVVSTALTTFIQTRALLATANPGAAIFTAVLGAGEVALMLALMNKIRQGDAQAQAEIQNEISLIRYGGTLY